MLWRRPHDTDERKQVDRARAMERDKSRRAGSGRIVVDTTPWHRDGSHSHVLELEHGREESDTDLFLHGLPLQPWFDRLQAFVGY